MLYGVVSILLVSTVVAAAASRVEGKVPEARMGEGKLTQMLQEKLADYDPYIIPYINNINLNTKETRVMVNLTNTIVKGASAVKVTSFTPPSLFSNKVVMELSLDSLMVYTDNYTMSGTFNGHLVQTGGPAEMIAHWIKGKVVLVAESFSYIPVAVCLEERTISIDLTADAVKVVFAGQDFISEDLSDHSYVLMDIVKQWVLSHEQAIIQDINSVLCSN